MWSEILLIYLYTISHYLRMSSSINSFLLKDWALSKSTLTWFLKLSLLTYFWKQLASIWNYIISKDKLLQNFCTILSQPFYAIFFFHSNFYFSGFFLIWMLLIFIPYLLLWISVDSHNHLLMRWFSFSGILCQDFSKPLVS